MLWAQFLAEPLACLLLALCLYPIASCRLLWWRILLPPPMGTLRQELCLLFATTQHLHVEVAFHFLQPQLSLGGLQQPFGEFQPGDLLLTSTTRGSILLYKQGPLPLAVSHKGLTSFSVPTRALQSRGRGPVGKAGSRVQGKWKGCSWTSQEEVTSGHRLPGCF